MKLNKEVCRKLIEPKWSMDLNHGLLCAEQIQHIVGLEVRNVDHQRVLILHICDREEVATGEIRPLWIMFQGRKRYFTLAHHDDSSTLRRGVAFDNLGRYHLFKNKCASYSMNDEKRVVQFYKADQKDGFSCLNSLQSRMMHQDILQGRYKMQRKIIGKMKTVPGFPRGIKGWIDREIVSAHIFYMYSEDRKEMDGYCTVCKQAVKVSGIKYNAEGNCPHCDKIVTYKSRGWRGIVIDRGTVQVLQKISEEGLVVHFIKVYRKYLNADMSEDSFYRSARIFINSDREGHRKSEHFYRQFSCQDITPWEKGNRPVFSKWQHSFNVGHNGHLYDRNPELVLENTSWRYSQLGCCYRANRASFHVMNYLQRYLDYLILEYMVELGPCRLTTDIVNPDYYCCALSQTVNEKGKNTREVLGLNKSHLLMPQEINPGSKQLALIKRYLKNHIYLDVILFSWYVKNGVNRLENPTVPLQYTTAYKLVRYADGQFEMYKTRGWATTRYRDVESLPNGYRDYLPMCEALEYDSSNSFVLYLANLSKAHDKVSNLSDKEQAKMCEGQIRKLYKELSSQYAFPKHGYFIILPCIVKGIIGEGHRLHHCIGTYVRMVVKRQRLVLLVRKINGPEEPPCIVELNGAKTGQTSMFVNWAPAPPTKVFLEEWEREILQVLVLQSAV